MAIKRPKRPLLSLAFFLMLLGLASVKLVHERFASSRALAEPGPTTLSFTTPRTTRICASCVRRPP
jgi:hypothetical protein